ncbi:MAG: bifunctional diaminohydroxyphosphoribosylaminopyrimidine deaminase/5-amino-6-(5-phosphoribosylamino)uracil reductase RibD, partial [Planctomycetota bacterium]
MSELDDIFMKRAIKLAWEAQGWTAPNPLVGCVIVKDGRIIGEGKHERFGESHAEINALKNCTESPEGSTIYVTLEPCVHFGKTPPCVHALTNAKVSRVVIGSKDPNPKAAGGADYLEQKGVRVDRGILNAETLALNAAFYKTITTGLPFLTVKWAMTIDGKIATTSGDSQWVSGESSRKFVHFLRGTHRAVMIGSGTLLADNPAMNCRISGLPQPLRVFIDGRLRFPPDAKALSVSPAGDCVIACLEQYAEPEKINVLQYRGAKILVSPAVQSPDGNSRIDLVWVLRY